MQDMAKDLSPQQMARLIKYLDGNGDDVPDGATLHAEKNAPWVNGMYSNIRFPPYVFQPYPKWLYNAQWMRADEQWRNALTLRGRRGRDQDDTERIIADAAAVRADCMKLVQGPEEERLLGSGWFDSPGAAVEGQETLDRAVAQAAAESAWDDRNMGVLAKREREAADAASETHLVEVPRKKKPRGRPFKKKTVETPVESTP